MTLANCLEIAPVCKVYKNLLEFGYRLALATRLPSASVCNRHKCETTNACTSCLVAALSVNGLILYQWLSDGNSRSTNAVDLFIHGHAQIRLCTEVPGRLAATQWHQLSNYSALRFATPSGCTRTFLAKLVARFGRSTEKAIEK